jgi:hypothetical protein
MYALSVSTFTDTAFFPFLFFETTQQVMYETDTLPESEPLYTSYFFLLPKKVMFVLIHQFIHYFLLSRQVTFEPIKKMPRRLPSIFFLEYLIRGERRIISIFI